MAKVIPPTRSKPQKRDLVEPRWNPDPIVRYRNTKATRITRCGLSYYKTGAVGLEPTTSWLTVRFARFPANSVAVLSDSRDERYKDLAFPTNSGKLPIAWVPRGYPTRLYGSGSLEKTGDPYITKSGSPDGLHSRPL